jgi:DNA-binding transcriptional ArsR family regulator
VPGFPLAGHHLVCGPPPPGNLPKPLDILILQRILKYVLNNQGAGGAELDSIFQALADPTRRAIIVRLCEGPASVSELAKPFSMSLPAIVQHVQVLEHSGLVQTEKIGRVRSCSIVPASVRLAEGWLSRRRTDQERRLDRLETFLAAGSGEAGDDPATRD